MIILPIISRRHLTGLLALACCFLSTASVWAQSVSLPTDRARVTVASIPDPYGGPNLKVLRTDANTPLRAGTAWIWEKQGQEEPASYYVSMKAKGLNSFRMILFDTWEVETYSPGPNFTPTDWNDVAYRTRQLARMERSVNYASANGMYVIINSHNHIPSYNESYVNALWTWVAPYFANRTHVLYELANEPMNGIGPNGDMDTGGNAQNSERLQALKRGYNIARAGAPDTHLMILTPPGINDYAYGTGMGNLAASFAALPGVAVDWTKTSVAYHLYNNDAAYGVANNAANLRNLHSRYPGWPSENAFPPGNIPGAIGLDEWRSQPFPGDNYVNQTCERLGLGWSMWFINGQNQLDTNFPIMWADAVANGYAWAPDPVSSGKVNLPMANTAPVIDGILDTAWAGAATNNFGNVVIGTVSSANDLSGTWRGMWDASNFYVFVDVTDNVKINDSGVAWYDDDLVEIFIDANNSKGTSYDGVNDYQYVLRWSDPAVLETKLARTAGVTFARVGTATGYRIEIKFPWSTLGLTPTTGSRIGLEVMVNDDDDGGARDRKVAWQGTTDGAWQNPSLFGVAELVPPIGTGTGLRGDYYDNADFTGTLLTRTEATVNFDWGNGSPDASMGVDTYSVRWTGQVQPRFSESYTFSTTTDDGARLWVNGQLIVDKWLDQAPTEWSGNITLTAGQTYDLRLDYYENTGGAQAKLFWSSTSQNKEIIPQAQLFPAATAPAAPAAPSALGVAVVSASQLNLTWTDNANNESVFKIERKTGSGGTYAQIATTAANVSSFSDSGLIAGTQYYYRVRANNTGGDSAYSAEASATTLPNAPAAPSALAVAVVSASQLNLTWTDNANNETGFKIERKTGSGGTYAQIGTTAANVSSFSDSGLTAATTYFYRVRANNTGGDSAYSAEASATTPPNPPAAPSALAATAVTGTQINLAWTDNATNETGFKIERKTGSGGTYAQIATTSANVTSYSNSGLSTATQYYYRVRANNAGGDSAYSAEANATAIGNAVYGNGGLPWPVPGIIESENYDTGGEGVAYYDTSAGNGLSTTFRTADNVDVKTATDTTGGYAIGSFAANEWVKYTVNVTASGTYALNARVCSIYSGRTFRVEFNGVDKTGPIAVPVVSAWDTYYLTVSVPVTLSAGPQVMRVVMGGIDFMDLNWIEITAGGTLPSPLQNQDIGAVGLSGSASHTNSIYTVIGAGADIYGSSDGFQYVHQTSSGDCTIIARVASLQSINVWSKAGVMIRETLTANAVNAAVVVTPGNGVSFQWRTSTGGATSFANVTGVSAPRWVKLTRTGNTFTASYSANGTTWIVIGSPQTITMAGAARLGLAVTSHDAALRCTATFDNVTPIP